MRKKIGLMLTAILVGATALVMTGAPSQASGYYRIETRWSYAGHPLCLQSNGNQASVTVAVCTSSTRQKWAREDLNGYAIYANVGYLPALALDAPTLSGGTTVQTRAVQGNAHQGWIYDSAYQANGVIYLQYNSHLVLQPTSVTPGAVVKLQPWAGVTGIQSWNVWVW